MKETLRETEIEIALLIKEKTAFSRNVVHIFWEGELIIYYLSAILKKTFGVLLIKGGETYLPIV